MRWNSPTEYWRAQRRFGRRRGARGGGFVIMALGAGLMVGTSLPAGSQESPPPAYFAAGTLDLFADDATGDGFEFIPTDPAAATLTENFSSSNKSELIESGSDLVTLEAFGPSQGKLPYAGLKNHEIGVRSKGEGSGTPASRVDSDEKLTITLGPDLPGDYAWYAQIALSAKFGADEIIVKAFNGSTEVASVTDSCVLNDCGSDSGGDRREPLILDGRPSVVGGEPAFLFTSIEISVTNTGAVSLIDDPLDGFNTYLEIVEEFDGTLACVGDVEDDEFAAFQSNEDGFSSTFFRLNTEADNCKVLKPYNDDIDDEDNDEIVEIQFEPDSTLKSVYRAELTFPAGTGAQFLATLEYDEDGPGPLDFVDLDTCGIRDASTYSVVGGTTIDEAAFFPELAGLGSPGADGFPTMPGGETSCVVSFSSVIGGDENWVLRVDADPWFR
jgi:hypothetical protein